MDNIEDIMNNAKIKKILSEMEGKTHIPFEVMLADVEGNLSSDGHSKIERHMETCDGCSSIFQQIKNSFDQKESSAEKGEAVSSISVDATLVLKLKLTTTVNSQKDEIIREIARLLLPEDSWFCIKPAVVMYRDWLKTPIEHDTETPKELQIAAFSSGSDGDRENIEIITEVIKFVDYICDLLLERCNSLKEVKQELSIIVVDAWNILGEIQIDQKIKNKVLGVMESVLIP